MVVVVRGSGMSRAALRREGWKWRKNGASHDFSCCAGGKLNEMIPDHPPAESSQFLVCIRNGEEHMPVNSSSAGG